MVTFSPGWKVGFFSKKCDSESQEHIGESSNRLKTIFDI